MYIFYILNYPSNNSTYFWHIVSIAKKDLNAENRFVGQIMTSLLGVNSEYDKSIDTSAFGNYHLIILFTLFTLKFNFLWSFIFT